MREVKAWEEKHGRTLFDERCPIRFIITVQALREGWDCPFAYVLCSVAELGTSTAVEQILGRVFRMPKATLKAHEDLNHAYTFVTSQRFGQVAATVEGLTQALEANGFTRFEAQQEIDTFGTPLLPSFDGPLFGGVVAERSKTPGERAENLGTTTGAVAGRRAVSSSSRTISWAAGGHSAAATPCCPRPTFQRGSARIARWRWMSTRRADSPRTGSVTSIALNLLARDETMSADGLVLWLDTNIPHGQSARRTCRPICWM